MPDAFISRQELHFLLFDWLKIDQRTGGDRATFEAVLDLAEQLSSDLFLPHCRTADLVEPYLDASGVHILPEIRDALEKYSELGLFSLTFPERLGGLGMPTSLGMANLAIFSAASIATAAYPMLTAANARLISAFGTPAQVDQFALPQIAGRWFGTMCLSEPQAGSSLGDIRTRALLDGEDALGQRYRLCGNKMWISGGDQDASENIVHLVLAKVTQDGRNLPEGSQSISLFIVPKILPDGTRNDVAVAGLNHKLGYRGTANCLLNFGEKSGAIGWRVGAEGDGLRQMFMMMNEARISVGIGASALAMRGYRHAVKYASERLQGRPIGQRGGDPVPIIEHVDVRHMLLQQKAYAEGALALCLYCADLTDRESDADAQALLGLLTPIAKSWPSEFGLIANDLAIQVHGGYGYTRDFDVEQVWRDNRLNPIHEGTTAIQAIDLLGRKILKSDGAGLAVLRHRLASVVDNIPKSLAREAAQVVMLWDRVVHVISRLRETPSDLAFDDATLFLRAFGHAVIGWMWLEQARAVQGHADSRLREAKLRSCQFFIETEGPQAMAWLQIIEQQSRTVRDAPVDIFA